MNDADGQSSLPELLARGQSGDQRSQEMAYAELVRLISIFVRAGMGNRLRDHRESVDVCQSIAKSFFAAHRDGNLGFDSEGALVQSLKPVVQPNRAGLARRDQARKRGGAGRVDEPKATSVPGGVGKRQPLDDEPIDHQQVDESIRLVEASQIVNAHLDERDQQIVQMRMEGLDWNQIAEALGESSTALRKHWSRLADQLARELGVKPDPKSSN